MKKLIFIYLFFVLSFFYFFSFQNTLSSCDRLDFKKGSEFYNNILNNVSSIFPNGKGLCDVGFYEALYKRSVKDGERGVSNIALVCKYINSKSDNKGFDQCFFNIGTSIIYSQRSQPLFSKSIEKS